MEKGEIRSNQWDRWKAQRPEWIKNGKRSNLPQFGPKVRELGDVPDLLDLVTDPHQRAMVDRIEVLERVGRSVFTSPRISPDRLAIWRQAFGRTVRDPDYIARMKELGLETSSRAGGEQQLDLDRATTITEDSLRELIRTLNLH